MHSRSFSRRASSSSRRGRTALVLVALLAVVVALLVWRTRAAPHAEPLELEHVREPVAPASELDVARPSSDAAARSTVDEASISPAKVADFAPVDTVPRDPVDVLVVDKVTGEPVAGAEVLWANSSELGLPFDPSRPRWRIDVPAALERVGRRATSDAQGIAHVDSRVFPGHVVAVLGNRSGVGHAYDPTVSPIRVEIAREYQLAVQVVDANGAPVAGVPVCLRDAPNLDTMSELWQGTTQGRDGIARVRDLRQAPGSPLGPAYACIEIPSLPAVCAEVDLANPPAEPVRITLPPCGSVVVALRDSRGEPAIAQAVMLGHAKDVGKDGSLRWGARSFDPDSIEKGDVHFSFVALGLDLHVTAMSYGTNAEVDLLGPTKPGEVIRVEVALGDPVPVLLGRLITAAGEPLRDRLVQIGLESKHDTGSSGGTQPAVTDSSGRFRIPYVAKLGKSVSIVLRAKPTGIGPGENGSAQREVVLAEAPAEHDLGDLVVQEPRMIGSGEVVDDTGATVRDALLGVYVSRPEVDSGAWRQNPLVTPVKRAEGRFAIEALVDVARVRVHAIKQGHAESARVEFEPGASDLRLVVPRACELAGRVLLDADVDGQRIRARLLVPGQPIPAEQFGSDREVRIAADGSFRFTPIAPGRYDVDFRFLAKGEPFGRVEGIEVAPAGKSVDARLDAIDLRGKALRTAPR